MVIIIILKSYYPITRAIYIRKRSKTDPLFTTKGDRLLHCDEIYCFVLIFVNSLILIVLCIKIIVKPPIDTISYYTHDGWSDKNNYENLYWNTSILSIMFVL